jgi:heterodisulfide reductase subunit A
MRIGVYVCHCGGNISDVVDVKKVNAVAEQEPEVAFVRDAEHMCSEDGQKLICDDVLEQNLDRVVVASCSPLFHENTFMKTVAKAGINPYLFEMANLREQCSWAHPSKAAATRKAEDLVKMAIAKCRLDVPLARQALPIGRDVLIVGGGIAGIQAALDLADAGFQVTLVEREPAIGGKMVMLSKTFPTEDCATCIIGPKLADVSQHPNIRLLTYAEVEEVSGYLGNFNVKVRRKARYVDWEKCVACGTCAGKCPTKVPDEFNQGLSQRKAIYLHNPIAVPHKYLIDGLVCRRLKQDGNACGVCEKLCAQKAINFADQDETIEIRADTIIGAMGFDLFDATLKPVYNFGHANVITALQLERIIATGSSGPPLRAVGNRVAFIQCVGSRDEQINRENCSRICCMYATKLAQLLLRIDPTRDITIFYTDLRAYGKGFEEYYKRAQKAGIQYIRGRVAEVQPDPEGRTLWITVEDTLSREIIESEYDLVVLSAGLVPARATDRISELLKLAKSPDGFLQEAHPKFRPVDTLVDGVFIAGCVQGPKDIPDTVSQASAAAARAIRLMNKGVYETEPVKAFVHEERCDGCGQCVTVCPVRAISTGKQKAQINQALCKGCGICIGSCPTEALDLHFYTTQQLEAQIEKALEGKSAAEPRLLIFADNVCTYRLADNLGTGRLSYPAETRIIRIPSSARISPQLMLYAFHKGADAIFLGECDHKASPYTGSVDAIERNLTVARWVLEEEGVSPERIRFSELLASLLTDFYKNVTSLVKLAKKEAEPITPEQRERLGQRAKGPLPEVREGAVIHG